MKEIIFMHGVDMQEFSQPIIQLSYKCIGFYGKKGFNTINVGLKPLKIIMHLAVVKINLARPARCMKLIAASNNV